MYKKAYPGYDNCHLHVNRLFNKQLVIAWLVKETGEPRFIPDPAEASDEKGMRPGELK